MIPGLDTAVVLVLLPEEQQHPPRIVVCRAGALAPVQVEVFGPGRPGCEKYQHVGTASDESTSGYIM